MSESLELDAAAQQVRAIHAWGGRRLTKTEVVELLERPMYLGAPKPIPPKAHGRKPKSVRTQYDASYLRWRGLHHRAIRLPALASESAASRHAEIESLLLELLAQGTPRRKLVSEASTHLQLRGAPCPDERTLRRILARIRPNFPK
jgi:hypothetical protein